MYHKHAQDCHICRENSSLKLLIKNPGLKKLTETIKRNCCPLLVSYVLLDVVLGLEYLLIVQLVKYNFSGKYSLF